MRPLLLALSVVLAPTLQAGDLQEVGRVNIVDVADQWEILVPGYEYPGRFVLVRADLEHSCFESGEQAVRWFLTWVTREKQNSILEAADLRGWPDRDGTCVVSLVSSSLSGRPGELWVFRWDSVPTEIGEPVIPGPGGGAFGDSYVLEPIVVDGTVTGFMHLTCRLTGFCDGGPQGLLCLPGESPPGGYAIDGDVLSVIQMKGEGSTTYRMVTQTTGRLVDGLFKKEPAMVEYEIAARVTEVARLRLVAEPLGEDAAQQLAEIRGLLEQSSTAKAGMVTREILRSEYLDGLLRNLGYRSTLPRDHVSEDLSPGVPR